MFGSEIATGSIDCSFECSSVSTPPFDDCKIIQDEKIDKVANISKAMNPIENNNFSDMLFYRINGFSVCFWNFIGELGGFHVMQGSALSAQQQFVYLFFSRLLHICYDKQF